MRNALDAAEAGVEAARTTEGRVLVEAFIGDGDIATSSPVEDAKAAASAAAQRLSRLRQVEETLRQQIAEAEKEQEYARRDLEAAIKDVIKADAPVAKLLAEARASQARFVEYWAALDYLLRNGFIDEANISAAKHFVFDRPNMPENHPAAESWRAACKALETDADAPLPA